MMTMMMMMLTTDNDDADLYLDMSVFNFAFLCSRLHRLWIREDERQGDGLLRPPLLTLNMSQNPIGYQSASALALLLDSVRC